jgi:Fe-S-cluster containining protein
MPTLDPDTLFTLRTLLLRTEELRGDLLHLAARVIALEEHIAPSASESIDDREHTLLSDLQAADDASHYRLHIAEPVDKYTVDSSGPDCASIIPICQARCCTLSFPLSTQDLDENLIQFDLGRPYLIAHADDGHCVHLDRTTRGCGCYSHRPAICRTYDCRTDPRIWSDFSTLTLAPPGIESPPPDTFALHERARLRELALAAESFSIRRRT